MAKPFDNAAKQLVEAYPGDWLTLANLSGGPVEIIAADVSTVIADADRVVRVGGTSPCLAHFEFQTTYDPDMPERMLRYNVLLRYRHRLPVQSLLVLFRPAADGPNLANSAMKYETKNGYLKFGYETLRVWQIAPETVLQGGLGTLPLAPISKVAQSDIPAVVREMEARITKEATPNEAGTIWLTTYLLMGLSYTKQFADNILQGVRGMEDSVTYREILERGEARGRADEARRIIEQIGSKRFGLPDASSQARLAALTSPENLEALASRLLDVENWDELFDAG